MKNERFFCFNNDEKERIKSRIEERERLFSDYAARESNATRRGETRANSIGYRTEFVADIERIINNPFYNRYTDKTQVFSFYKNDDITRRALHVQLVSRIARNIGLALGLNPDLIEAISLGHDIGHTPFGHEGERILDRLYKPFKKSFNHNVHSVKVLDIITNVDRKHSLTLETLDGILCHNGEKVHECYEPGEKLTFEEFERRFERCYTEPQIISGFRPFTMEGCVVRVADVIAYVGKDRQDLYRAGLGEKYNMLEENPILGKNNSDFVSRLTANVIKNSLRMNKRAIGMDKEVYEALDAVKADNFKMIYRPDGKDKEGTEIVEKMAKKLFGLFYNDIASGKLETIAATFYLKDYITGWSYKLKGSARVTKLIEPEDIAIDFIASMTDDYFIEIFRHYFPNDELNGMVNYVPYVK